MNIKKSTKFEGAYIIKGLALQTEHSEVVYQDKTRHMFLKDAKILEDKVEIPYVFYSRNYKKWYEDVAYISKDEYKEIKL